MSEAEVVLVMNFVKGTDLERVLFSKKYAKEVSLVTIQSCKYSILYLLFIAIN